MALEKHGEALQYSQNKNLSILSDNHENFIRHCLDTSLKEREFCDNDYFSTDKESGASQNLHEGKPRLGSHRIQSQANVAATVRDKGDPEEQQAVHAAGLKEDPRKP